MERSDENPEVEIRVGYKNPRTFLLTPSRKKMGKAIARKSKKTVAQEALRDPITKLCIVKMLGKELRQEVKTMSSQGANSILKSPNTEHLKEFTWDMILSELSKFAPLLKSLLCFATKTRTPRSNTDAVIGMCAAMMFKHQNRNMNLVQRINSLVLYAGHAPKKVYERLQTLNFTLSPSSVIRLVDKIGKDFDAPVKEWRETIVSKFDSENEIKPVRAPWFISTDQDLDVDLDDNPDTESESGSDSDSDASWVNFSPVTSDDEFHSDLSDDSSSDLEDESQEVPMATDNLPSESAHAALQPQCESFSVPAQSIRNDYQLTSGCSEVEHMQGQKGDSTLYHLCGDNIDFTVKQRYMRIGNNKPDSIHYFHLFAVADRIDCSNLHDQIIATQQTDPSEIAASLLPTPADDTALRDNICVLMSKILCDHVEFFKTSFEDVVEKHIKHEFYEEMSMKSIVKPLGIIPKDENTTEDMIAIMCEMHQYVPMVEIMKEVYVPSLKRTAKVSTALAHKILFAGDQKTAARGRGAQKAKVHELSPLCTLSGLIPVVADWHTKVKLLEVIWRYFYSPSSQGDHGTLYQLRNKLNRCNVIRTPKNDVNACQDFLEIVTAGLVVAAALATFHQASTNDYPNESVLEGADIIWTLPDEERQRLLKELSGRVYDKFITFNYNSCDRMSTTGDGVHEYSVQLLRSACLYMELADAIREGDGGRVLRCWKYLLPIFCGSGNKNYACDAANFLLQHLYTLTPRQSLQLLWSRFVNVHGKPGRNIPVDLHMEHLNKIAKGCIGFLGCNKSQAAILRIGRAIGTLSPILDNFDCSNKVGSTSGKQKKPGALKDVKLVVEELVKAKSFAMQQNERRHKHFPHPKDLLHAKERSELIVNG